MLFCVIFLCCLLMSQDQATCAQEPKCPYPARPKTGLYQLVPNGGFETGFGSSAEFWDVPKIWEDYIVRDMQDSLAQLASMHILESFSNSGPGVAVFNRSIAVTSGETYVLSGYILNSIKGGGNAYLDLADARFETHARSTSGFGEVEFVCGTFTVPEGVSEINVRLVADGQIKRGSNVYFDDIAVTAESLFVRPPIGR